MSHLSAEARIRAKSDFLDADDPDRMLLEFFGQLGSKVRPESQQDVAVKSRPLILISQLPRSGGSLLGQLLDGHPELLVYPWEMKIGFPSKNFWPALESGASPSRLFATLFHPELAYLARKGYRKSGKAVQTQERLEFNYSPAEHYRNFVRLLAREPTQRAILDTYFTTFFQAWQPEAANANYVAGFVPNLAKHRASVSGFFKNYPDGRLISILRDPADWFASLRAHTKFGATRFDDVVEEMATWNRMAELALAYRAEHSDRFLLLSFKDLVSDREGTMRRVCAWCGIKFDPCLLRQTFDGKLISPNTNFGDPIERLAEAVLDRKQRLTEEERERAYELTERPRTKLQTLGWTG